MKSYLFSLAYVENGHKENKEHSELFECDADAMQRAREILKESKRDGCGIQIDVYRKNTKTWHHVVSYQ